MPMNLFRYYDQPVDAFTVRVQSAWVLEAQVQCVLRSSADSASQSALVRTDFAFEPYIAHAADLVAFATSTRVAVRVIALALPVGVRRT